MDESKFSGLLIFFVANYFFSFLIIGLAAGLLSLVNKPKPLRADVVAEALFSYYLLFTIGINNLVNFVFHVFVGDLAAEFIGWVRESGRGYCRSDCIQSKLAVSICNAHTAFCVRLGRSCRAHLSDDRGA